MQLRASTALFLLLVCAATVRHDSARAQSSPLPVGWSSADIGSPGHAGSVSGTPDTIVVRGGGSDIWESADQFHFAFHQVSGNIDIVVRVADLQGSQPWAKAGLMIRDSLSDDSRNVLLLVSAAQGLSLQWRTAPAAASKYIGVLSRQAPMWIRLVRLGNTYQAYHSVDGNTWGNAGSVTLDIAETAYVGLAVTSHEASETATATFTNLRENGASAPAPPAPPTPPPPAPTPMPPPAPAPGGTLPAPWASGDIGDPALGGSAAVSGTTAVVTASGDDIWNARDQFRFLYQPMSGNAEIVARVVGVEQTDGWAKAGVMIRESLSPEAAHAYMLASSANGRAFQRRPATYSGSVHTPGCQCSPPGWVRLVRAGNLFSGYESSDGATWHLVGTDNIPMASTVYVGLAVTSHNSAAASTATFTDLAIGIPANHPPAVSMTEPSPGAQFDAPATLIVGADAEDDDGGIARVEFYQGGQFIGAAASYPFRITWSNVPAGTYSLRAVATDTSGSTATSPWITVSVKEPVPVYRPSTLLFKPSVDHSAGVSSYSVQLRRAGETLTAPPSATSNLGKPAVVSGEISVDISAIVDPLPAGDYYAVVVTTGPGGSIASAASPVFSK